MALAGIRGGKKDSILPETTGVVVEVANFIASTIRKQEKDLTKNRCFYKIWKNLDTERVSQGIALALQLFKEIFPESKVVAFNDVYPIKTQREVIDVSEEFLNVRLGKVLPRETIEKY